MPLVLIGTAYSLRRQNSRYGRRLVTRRAIGLSIAMCYWMTRLFSINFTASISGHSIDSFQQIALSGEESQIVTLAAKFMRTES